MAELLQPKSYSVTQHCP